MAISMGGAIIAIICLLFIYLFIYMPYISPRVAQGYVFNHNKNSNYNNFFSRPNTGYHSLLLSRLAFSAFTLLLDRETQLKTPIAVVMASFSSWSSECLSHRSFEISIACLYSMDYNSILFFFTRFKAICYTFTKLLSCFSYI